jgi:hypothetical protein
MKQQPEGRWDEARRTWRVSGQMAMPWCGVFTAGDVADLGRAFDRIYAEASAHGRSFRHGNLFYRIGQDANLGPVVRLAQWPSSRDQVLNRFRLERRMFDIVAPLIGDNIKQIINQLHWKPPGATAVEFAYHQDCRFRRPAEAFRDLARSYVQTGIAIDAHRPENGCMRVVPGSHRLGELDMAEDRAVMDGSMVDGSLIRVGLDPARLVDLLLEPGDVALWNPYLVHGSGPNRTALDRRLYINGYVAAKNSDRGEWAYREGRPVPFGAEPALVHYDDLYARPEPHYVDDDH